jgi:hypothetical protein
MGWGPKSRGMGTVRNDRKMKNLQKKIGIEKRVEIDDVTPFPQKIAFRGAKVRSEVLKIGGKV